MPDIEKELYNCKINISGNYSYISTKRAKFEINLKLINEHYSIDEFKLWKNKGIAYEEKIPLIYKFSKKDPNKVKIFDGKEVKIITKTDFLFQKNKRCKTGKYTFIKVDTKCKKEDIKTLQQIYVDFIADADFLKEATNSKINMYKTGGYKNIALKFFCDLNPAIQPELIRQNEAEWIENATSRPMIWSKKYEGKAYKSDIVSQYGSIMRDQKFSIPIKEGTFKKLTNEEFKKLTFFAFGIYRCIIQNVDKRLFRKNPTFHYTHYDLTTAKDYGYEITLIEDDHPNVLLYNGTTRVNGDKIFRKYVDTVFEFKKKGLSVGKKLLLVLWGGLCQKNIIKMTHDEKNKEDFILFKNNKLTSILPLNDYTAFKIRFKNNDFMYETNFARMAPFLLARGRRMISNIMKPHINNVVRCHTDGFITNVKLDYKQSRANCGQGSLDYVTLGKEIGNIKYEGYVQMSKFIIVIK
jgi:hypothetical protein